MIQLLILISSGLLILTEDKLKKPGEHLTRFVQIPLELGTLKRDGVPAFQNLSKKSKPNIGSRGREQYSWVENLLGSIMVPLRGQRAPDLNGVTSSSFTKFIT